MVLFVQIFKLRASGILLALTQWLGLLLFVNRSSLEKNFTFGYARFPMSQDIFNVFYSSEQMGEQYRKEVSCMKTMSTLVALPAFSTCLEHRPFKH